MMTKKPDPASLSWTQTAGLAAGLLLIYMPIRVYLNVFPLKGSDLTSRLPFLAIEMTMTFFFFWGWISLVDKLLGQFARQLTGQRPGEVKLIAQLIALLVAALFALTFNNLFGHAHRRMDQGIEHEFPRLKHAPNFAHGRHPNEGGGQRKRLNDGLVVMSLLSAYYLTANRRSSRQMQALLVKAERLEKEAAQAQFAALRNQVNPHFLFNSLSILSSLVEYDAKLSIEFINQLSKAYRYILEQRDNERVPLRTELDFIQAYTFLLMIRFDERLQVRIDVAEADRDRYQIAPLTLQLLVENAVKHNQMSDEEPLVVTISREDDYLRVANRYQPRPHPDDSTGVGLQNIVSRYQLLSAKPVWVGEQDGEFVVKIPLLS
ncbi:sensor histidine kinase [Spirosoma arboris]|nr:histidine kinase [Spirosoma arboris]